MFGVTDEIDLCDYIDPVGYLSRTKCRVLYREQVEEVAYQPYRLRTIRSLRLVNRDTIDYQYKTADRSELDSLLALRDGADDILVVKNGLLTDTSFANIALWNGREWITPATPLLEGTHRAALLASGQLRPDDVHTDEIDLYQRICIFNAMIEFGEIGLPVADVLR